MCTGFSGWEALPQDWKDHSLGLGKLLLRNAVACSLLSLYLFNDNKAS